MSAGGANVGELGACEISVGGVEVREGIMLEALLTDDFSSSCPEYARVGSVRPEVSRPERLEDAAGVDGVASQFAQKCTVGPEGERMRGTLEHFEHILSVSTCAIAAWNY